LIHFLAFLVFGLPLFLLFHPKPGSRLWRWPFGIAIGAIIGVLSLTVVLALAYSRPVNQELFGTVGGALYGSITAIACLFNRPNFEQVGAANPTFSSQFD